MPAFGVLVFRDVSLVGRLENPRKNNAVETSNFVVAMFLI
jgi:hypothetical protein